MSKPTSICVFCGSRTGNSPAYMELASRFGTLLAKRDIRLVYGGGNIGLMGAAARACADAGGQVLGIIPEFLCSREIAFTGCELDIVDTLHTRKARMAEQSDGFVVLPGGLGTLEEVVEVLSWINLKELQQKVVLLDEDGYWDSFYQLLNFTINEGFTAPEVIEQAMRANTPEQAVQLLGV
ncbi:Lysine decarboxylase family [hydrothermal vent metagenome]|uniref:Lysine decarboxylase family n=1 Tax=hydrothermal vent metagenome TaxID=652676 RepID=A0A3B0RHL1_9ZZZZ